MDGDNPTSGAPGITQPGASQNSGAGAAADAGQGAKKSGDVGTLKFHLACSGHYDLPEFDTLEEAHAAAAEHLRTRHTPADGTIAKNAEVQITQVIHFTSEDAAKVKAPAKP